MPANIYISTQGAAFAEADGGAIELARILRDLADTVEDRGFDPNGDTIVLRDINGNRVGDLNIS